MITLVEFNTLESDAALLARITSACRLECKEIFTEEDSLSEHVRRLHWAVSILRDDGNGQAIMSICRAVFVLLALTPALDTVAKIQGVTDSNIRDAVRSVIKHFAIVGI